MKIITIILTAFLTVPVFAQAQYEQGMKKAFTLYGEGKLDEAANMFERIGNAEQDKWLPYYYVAQININKSWTVKDENVLKAQLDKAQEFINMATTNSKDNAEIMVLQAHLYTAYVAFDGQRYGMQYAAKVSEIYSKAKQLAPDNPRVVFSKAEWDMGSAKYFGQDVTPYCKDIERALELFGTFKNEDPFYPDWGADRAQEALKACKA
tara:strand:- start:24550 stop:25173 length:624 start_codon:yes stop_codon:yes gene_type:complete